MFTSRHYFYLCCFPLLLLLLVSGCKDRQQNNENLDAETLARYVSGYTSGVIGKLDPVRVQFAQPVGAEAADVPDYLDFSPSAKGAFSWENEYTLRFQPDAAWEEGREYSAEVNLVKLFPELKGKAGFTFQFTIRQTQVNIRIDGLYAADSDNIENQVVTGTIEANDDLRLEQLEGLVTVEQAGRQLPVSYQADPADATRFTFRADGVKRGATASEVSVSWNAEAIRLGSATGSQQLAVRELGKFEVVSVVYQQTGDPHLEVRFSDPLQGGQDLTGLVAIDQTPIGSQEIDGNILRIYLNNSPGDKQTLRLNAGIKNVVGDALGQDVDWEVNFTRPDPEVRAVDGGAIMPHVNQRLFPFEAIGLEAVWVEVFQIYASNVQQYLLNNELSGDQYNYGMDRVGRIIHQEKIVLRKPGAHEAEMDQWKQYAVDLGRFIRNDDRSIYQVRIGFGMEDARRVCDTEVTDYGIDPDAWHRQENHLDFNGGAKSMYGSYYGIYDVMYEDFEWSDRDNPCKPAFYNSDRFLNRNIISSNLGLIVKQSNSRQTVAIVTDLITGGPVVGAKVTFYDGQQQKLETGATDGDGRVVINSEFRPQFVMANSGNDVAYLKVDTRNALATSRFDTDGQSVAAGVKGTFYAERGVWRPGDSVYLNFVLENRLLKLPTNYPITFTLTDARGRLRDRRTLTPAVGNTYPLYFATEADDPTGNWHAAVEVGGKSFDKYLKIETVKPNRLKIDLATANGGLLTPTQKSMQLQANWLHGAAAANMTAEVEMQYQNNTGLYAKSWPSYVFLDPARSLESGEEQKVFSGTLNAGGGATFELPPMSNTLPGPLTAAFRTRVFEPGGNFSSDNLRADLVAFPTLAGLSLPENTYGSKQIPVGTDTKIDLASIRPDGKGIGGKKLSVGLYRVNWYYWWQDENDDVSRFNSGTHQQALETYTTTTNADGRAQVDVKVNRWGRYLLRVCDQESGHCSGDYFYAGSPQWTETDKDAAAMLALRMEDKDYEVGEEVAISLPTDEGGMLLVSLENAEGVIQNQWIEAPGGEATVRFKVDERMLPSIYASIMLLRPHAQTADGRPIRSYGIMPIRVVDPGTRLTPVIATADEYEPEQTISVAVSETDGKPMNYTLAVVDEGLLGLTRFQTPDLWETFFAREALTVETYDLFNNVIGNLDGKLNRILAIGGDGELAPDADKAKANRFEPVVRHLGPFSLPAGGKRTHRLTLPNYVGAVRVMVVAAGERNYGSAAKTVPVRKDLMILPTLPRVIGPGESISLPVNVFAMTGKVKNANIKVEETSGLVNFKVAKTRAVRFDAPGDQLVRFPFEVGDQTGIARFTVTAEGNGERISQEIEIDVRNPNAIQSASDFFVLQAGETKVVDYRPFGTPGTRTAALEVSGIPSLNLERHLQYLIRYPYGCVEQTTSPAFAQLHLADLINLDDQTKREVRSNVQSGINRLLKFQTTSGGMGYWQGSGSPQPWATNYALHFLLEAEAAGYTLPVSMKRNLIKWQRSAAADWRNATAYNYYRNDRQREFDHAYRLYTLALAGEADLGAMNRLRNLKKLRPMAKAYLAAAYALMGRNQVAGELLPDAYPDIDDYQELSYTFGSGLRDRAMLLSVLDQLGRSDEAGRLAVDLAKEVGRKRWLNTQEAAFVITAFAKYMNGKNAAKDLKIDFTGPQGSSNALAATGGILQVELPTDRDQATYTLTNNGQALIYVATVTTGQPAPGEEMATQEGMQLTVTYEDMEGKAIDVSRLKSGTDFVANYRVLNDGRRNLYYQELALRQVAASGWEINNERMDVMEEEEVDDDRRYANNHYDYRDFRDDRVFTFFDLGYQKYKTFRIRLTAAYPGRYYLPTQLAEAMYDQEITAAVKGQWVEVTE